MSVAALAALRGADGAALFAHSREPWLVRALLALHAATAAAAPLQLLARAPEPHAKFLLDVIVEQLREPSTTAAALAALPPLLYARPAWLHRLVPGPAPAHALARELPRAAARQTQPAPLVHALLALAALLAAAPAAAPPLLPELLAALLRPAALAAAPPAAAHLQHAQLALFHVLYATHPCSTLDGLRAELAAAAAPTRERLAAALQPLLASVRLHPALLARRNEADPARWARSDAHDVLAEARRLAAAAPPPLPPAAAPPPPAAAPPRPPPGCSEHAAAAALRARQPLPDVLGEDSAPPTPLPPDEPPEPAVEATPENTPAGEARAAFRFPEGGAARALGGRSTPASPRRSPPGDALAGRLARLAAERRAAQSPVPLGAAAPPDAARPTPRPAAAPAEPPPPPRAARALLPPGPGPLSPRGPRRRAASCPPRARAAAATQTDVTWPEPHEFLLEDFYRAMPPEPLQLRLEETAKPPEQLDAYLQALYSGQQPLAGGEDGEHSEHSEVRELREQLALTHAALQYERWRRDAHAERNRRLLGSVRAAREADLALAALAERLAAARAELAALRARAAPEPALPALQAQLAAESAARARLHAAHCDAAAARAADQAELRRARHHAAAADLMVQALARGAAAADRRADHARRLRRELLLLAERERRAAAAPPPPPPPPLWDAALRAQLARVEAELEAAAARAELGAARAEALEAALAAREAAAGELRRGARAALEAAEARRRALADKYAALRAAVRAGGLRGAAPPPLPPLPPLPDEPPPPLPPPA